MSKEKATGQKQVAAITSAAALTVMLCWLALTSSAPVPAEVVLSPAQECSSGAKLTESLVWQTSQGQSFPVPGPVDSSSVLRIVPCEGGTLTLRARSKDTREKPALIMSQQGTSIREHWIGTAKAISWSLKPREPLLLSYANDFDLLETRHLIVYNMKVRGRARCPGALQVNTTPGAEWRAAQHYGLFSQDSKLTLTTCGSGELILDLEGRIGGGAGPRLRITAEQSTRFDEEVRGERTVRVSISGPGHITLEYTGAYFQLSQQRSLLIDGIKFTPRQ